jgi:hypothetical protein
MASKTVLSVIRTIRSDYYYKRKMVGYPSSMRYDGSVGDCPADIYELFADLFESVYNAVVSAAFGFACQIWSLQFLASMRTRDPEMMAILLVLMSLLPSIFNFFYFAFNAIFFLRIVFCDGRLEYKLC